MKTALITGISGQGGAHLAKSLCGDGYHVVGTTRDTKQVDTTNLLNLGILDEIALRSLDLQDDSLVLDLIDQLRPDEIYHLAAPSSVARSFKEPAETIYSIALTTVNLLEAIRKTDKTIPCFVATSTEMFGNCEVPANKDTAHDPKSPYGIGKSCAHFQVRNYRQAYGLYVCSGILSNFESPLRPRNYVTSKIVSTACQIALGEAENIELGNLSVRRDWGSAAEFMNGARLTLQQEKPDDYVIATGVTHSLRDFLQMAFSSLGLDYRDHLLVRDSLLRPLDIKQTLCDPQETESKLAWKASTPLKQVVFDMVHTELSAQVGATRAAALMIPRESNVVTLNKNNTG
ncbi:MAG: GDP-mannose 4,6-dehydratase [Pseudomonadota bacterium]